MLSEIIIIFALILVNGFFAMAEIALVSARQARLRQLAQEGNRAAQQVLALLADPSRLLSTLQIGITMIGIFAGAYGGATLAEPFALWLNQQSWTFAQGELIAMVVVVGSISYLSLVVGEIVPKRIAVAAAEPIAMTIVPVLHLVAWLLAPMVWGLKFSTDFVLSLLQLDKIKPSSVTEDEVKQLIAEGTASGVFDREEKAMLESVLLLDDRTVRSIMTPRPEIVWLDLSDDPENLRAQVQNSDCSRLPLARESLDQIEGIVFAKDLLSQQLAGQPFDPLQVKRDVLLVPDTTPVAQLIEQLRQSSQHQAMVIDEYGTVEGMVTMTDVLAAIAGHLPDHDEADAAQGATRRDDGSWLLDGLLPLNEVEAALRLQGLQDEAEDYHTLAGFMIARLGRLPQLTDRVEWQSWRFEIIDMDGHRVDKVLASQLREPATLS